MSDSLLSERVITKHDLTSLISEQTGASHVAVSKIVQLFIDNITDHLAAGNDVALRNFGTFGVRVSQARIGRNPNKPEEMVTIPPRTVVKFLPGKDLRNKVLELTPVLTPSRKPAMSRRGKPVPAA